MKTPRNSIWFCVLSVLRSRALAVLLLAAGTVLACILTVMPMSFVVIRDDGKAQFGYTLTQDFDTLLAQRGLTIGEYDKVTFTGEGKYMEIDIRRAFPVYVTADGVTSRVFVTEATAGEALSLCQVELDPMDQLNFDLSDDLKADDRVIVTRVDYSSSYYTEDIPYTIEYTPSSIISTGYKHLISDGDEGSRVVSLRDKYVNGIMVASRETTAYVTKEPVNGTGIVGQRGAPISPLPPFEGVKTDENGAPLNYTAVYTGMRTSGYCDGWITASGLPAKVGHVGVDPREIPYGTRLYIASADGSLVYGYCIAADTGGGILYQDLVDIDLFFNTRWECRIMGKRDMVVYVLP